MIAPLQARATGISTFQYLKIPPLACGSVVLPLPLQQAFKYVLQARLVQIQFFCTSVSGPGPE